MRTLQWDATTSPERSAGQIPTNRTVRVTKLTSRHRVSNQGYVQRLILNIKKKRERERDCREGSLWQLLHTLDTQHHRVSHCHTEWEAGIWTSELFWSFTCIKTLSRNIYIWPRKTQENKSLKQATDFFFPGKNLRSRDWCFSGIKATHCEVRLSSSEQVWNQTRSLLRMLKSSVNNITLTLSF